MTISCPDGHVARDEAELRTFERDAFNVRQRTFVCTRHRFAVCQICVGAMEILLLFNNYNATNDLENDTPIRI